MGKIKVLYVTAETYPYAYVGGLGEVGASLPKALSRSGEVEIHRVLPGYKNINCNKKIITDFPVPMGKDYDTCVLKTDPDNREVPTYFIGNDRYFYRDAVYGHADDGFRFFFFCSAVTEMLKNIPFQPDIIHVNDWHTGFIPLLVLKKELSIKTVFTIHNILYRGFIPESYLDGMLTDEEAKVLGRPEYLDFMKAGLIYAHRLTTVSPGYSKEICKPPLSGGLEPLIKNRGDRVTGILNGIDQDGYNPLTDGVLTYPYSVKNIENKKKNRRVLRKKLGLADEDIPLVSMVTRLDWAKGIDLVIGAMELLEDESFQLVIHGSGNPYYQGLLMEMTQRFPSKVVVDFQYSPVLAKEIYAASDLFLMPSAYEPCGVGQLYAMRYGVVPVVNPVGGLGDTIIDCENTPEKNNGFHMKEWRAECLAQAMKRAFSMYKTSLWNSMVENGMKSDWSWEKSVQQYIDVYRDVLSMNETKGI